MLKLVLMFVIFKLQVKTGPSAGTFVPLASIVVTDQSGVEMKVVLWRRAAFWALTVSPGDVLFITGKEIQLALWQTNKVNGLSNRLLDTGLGPNRLSRDL